MLKFLDSPAADVLDGIIFLIICTLMCIVLPISCIIGICVYLF